MRLGSQAAAAPRHAALRAARTAVVILAAAGVGGGPARSAPLQASMMQGAQPCVALTFDDGPDPTLTPKLLSILEAKGVHATFFVLGWRVAAGPAPLVRALQDGDEIGNHTWDHPPLPSLSNDAALSELARTDVVITQATGHAPTVARAPYGSMSDRIAGLSPRTYVAWNIDTLDWKYPDVNWITNAALKAVNGSIILMHDIHPRTIDAVPGIIDGLRARGFQFVTASQMLSGACGGTVLAFGTPAPVPDPFGVYALQGQQAAAKPAAPAKAVAAAPAAAKTTPVKVPAAVQTPPVVREPFHLDFDDN